MDPVEEMVMLMNESVPVEVTSIKPGQLVESVLRRERVKEVKLVCADAMVKKD